MLAVIVWSENLVSVTMAISMSWVTSVVCISPSLLLRPNAFVTRSRRSEGTVLLNMLLGRVFLA